MVSIALVVDIYYISGWYIHEPKAKTLKTGGTYPSFFRLKHA